MFSSLLKSACSFSMLLFVSSVYGQRTPAWSCADDSLIALQKRLSPSYETRQRVSDIRLSNYVGQVLRSRKKPLFNGRATGDSAFTIPVVVHVIYPAGQAYGTGANISYAQIRSQVEALNAAFGKNYPAYNGQSHPAYAQDTRIRFCLARNTADTVSWFNGPGGPEAGVKRYGVRFGEDNHFINPSSAAQLLNVTHPVPGRFPFDKYLNIWLVSSIEGGNNVMGYAPRPIMGSYPLDGVVIRADIFGDNSAGAVYPLNFGLAQGKILAHEIGHYLNLYHIFQGGCAGANPAGAVTDACDLNGDMISDIEPAATQNIYCTDNIPNTCTANYETGTTTLDMINDYMSYADDRCMNTFTLNQSQRMWATLTLDRQTLWSAENLVATGVLGNNGCVPPYLNAQISTNNSTLCAGQPILFSVPVAGNTATSFEWQFPGGEPATASTNEVIVKYPAAGTYKVAVQASDGTNKRTDSIFITTLECHLDSSLLTMSQWYFGQYGTLDFRAGTPVPTTTALDYHTIRDEQAYPAQLSFIQATASVCDSSGRLLFYSNAVSVWNSDHQKISTSPIFGESDANASTGVCYVPYPGQPNKYFIVGASAELFNPQPAGLRFAEIDLAANNVKPYHQFRHTTLAEKLSEFVTVVPHCNGTDYWLIAHGYDEDRRFYSFLVTKDGIDPLQAPVISYASHPGYQGSGNQLKANRKGDKLVLCSPHGLGSTSAAIYDFDNQTGMVKNERNLPDVSGYSDIQSGTAFSPNGDYFYLMRSSNFETNGEPYWLFQYRVKDLAYQVAPAPGFYFASPFQPGPDNQIYVATQDNYVARISNPDKWGGATVQGHFINMRQLNDSIRTNVSFPAFIDAGQPQPTHPDFSVEAVNCSNFRFAGICLPTYTATWDFGDGSTAATGNVIAHNYPRPGDYKVSLRIGNGNTILGSVTKTVTVLPLFASISGPQNICTSDTRPSAYFTSVLPGVDYQWSVTGGKIAGASNLPFADVSWPREGAGSVTVSVSRDNCVTTATITVLVTKGPDLFWTQKDSVCIYDSSLLLTASPEGGLYSGNGVRGNRFYPSEAGVGNHVIAYGYQDEVSCLGQIQRTIKVRNCNIPSNAGTACEDLFKDVQVAPNPVGNLLQLRSTYVLKFAQVFNAAGQKVAEGHLINNSLRLPVLASGLYSVVIYCERDNSFRAYKFLKID